MRWFGIVAVIALVGCSSGRDTYVVEDPLGLAKSASLKVCGLDLPLDQKEGSLTATVTIACEGEGRIHVLYNDGRTAECPIGYVTAGAEQRWLFRLEPTSCKIVLGRVGPVT